MKKQIVSLALTTFFGLGTIGVAVAAPTQDQAANAPAKTWQHRNADPNRQADFLTRKLNLTADQKNQLLPILTDRQQQVAGIKADTSLSAQDRHAKMKAVRENSESQIRALLNDNQKQAYDQMLQQQHARMQQRRVQRQNGSQS